MRRFVLTLVVSAVFFQQALAAQYESGRFSGRTDYEGKRCSITIELTDEGDYAYRYGVEYYLILAFRTTPDVDCPGEHKRFVGFQSNGKSEKEIEICVGLDGKFLQYNYEQFDGSLVEEEFTCLIDKRVK